MPCRVSGVQTELTQKDLLPKGRRSFLLRRAGGFVRSRPKQKNDRFRRTGLFGGRYRTRTCDLLHVKQMLYQLS